LRVVADALDFTELVVGHETDFVIFFGKPDRGVDGDTSFAKGGERDVALSVNFGRDGHHRILLN